jgi:hypothetical protein
LVFLKKIRFGYFFFYKNRIEPKMITPSWYNRLSVFLLK